MHLYYYTYYTYNTSLLIISTALQFSLLGCELTYYYYGLLTADMSLLEKVEVVYETLPGWNTSIEVREYIYIYCVCVWGGGVGIYVCFY